MPLPHQDHNKEPRENLDESHGAVAPRKAHLFDPQVDVEGHGQTEADTEDIKHNCRLFNVSRKTLGKVVDGDGRNAQRAVGNEDLGEAKDAPRQLAVQPEAEDADAERVADQSGQPQSLQPVLRFPVAATETRGKPEGNSIADKLAIREDKGNPAPVEKLDYTRWVSLLAQL